MRVPSALKVPISQYVPAATLGLMPAAIFFILILVVVQILQDQGLPIPDTTVINLFAGFVLILTALLWLASTLLIVYTRIPLTYTKKTFALLLDAGHGLVFAMPAFALATFPIDILDAVIARRRRQRDTRIPNDAAPPSRDRSSD